MNQIKLNNKDYDAIIVGAGFSGLYQLICLRDQLKLNCVVLETGDDVGGTWYWNRYPGARCDTESHAYSYYFSDELLKEWTWSERYPGHAEIRRYMNFVANKFDLKKDILFQQKVTSAFFNNDKVLISLTNICLTKSSGSRAPRLSSVAKKASNSFSVISILEFTLPLWILWILISLLICSLSSS